MSLRICWSAAGFTLAFAAVAFCQAPPNARPRADYLSPIAMDISFRATGGPNGLQQILQTCDEENAAAQRARWQKWFARTEVPSPAEIADEAASIAHEIEDQYLKVVARQPMSPDQRTALDADRLASRVLASIEASREQKQKVYSIAQQVVRQVAQPSENSSELFARRLAELQRRVEAENLAKPQGAASTRPVDGAQTDKPARPTTMKYHDPRTRASNPGRIELSLARLAEIEPLMAAPPPAVLCDASRSYWVESLSEHMWVCDTRAAVVVSTEPLLVAAYSDDLDAVVILQYPQWLVKKHGLEVGSRLAAVNSFPYFHPVGTDIVRGPGALHKQYADVFPIIADFVTDDQERVRQVKLPIREAEWQRCVALGQEYRKQFPWLIRNGSPLHSQEPAGSTRDVNH